MQSRLETVNLSLALDICSASFSDAQEKVFAILSQALIELPRQTADILPNIAEIQSLCISQDQIDILDALYLDLEEMGKSGDSAATFMAARFLSALKLYQTSTSHFELCEAIYEAMFATEQTL